MKAADDLRCLGWDDAWIDDLYNHIEQIRLDLNDTLRAKARSEAHIARLIDICQRNNLRFRISDVGVPV